MDNEKNLPQIENNNDSNDNTTVSAESNLGLEPNIAALFCYLFLGIGGFVFLILEKQNKQIRFAAVQSIVYALSLLIFFVIYTTLSAILVTFINIWSTINSFLLPILTFGFLSVWLMLMYKAYQSKEWELPIIGSIARSFTK